MHNHIVLACYDCGSTAIEELPDQVVCTECGVVQSFNMISEAPEWRNFAEDLGLGGDDKSRVGMPNAQLDTNMIMRKTNDRGEFDKLQKLRLRILERNRSSMLKDVKARVPSLVACMHLPSSMEQLAVDLADDFLKFRCIRGYKQGWCLVSACIFYATHNAAGGARTAQEVLTAMLYVSSQAEADMREHFYGMISNVYRTLLGNASAKYRDLLKLPPEPEIGSLRRLIQSVPAVPKVMEQAIFRKIMHMKYQLLQYKVSIMDAPMHVIHAILLSMACTIMGIKFKKGEFCKHTGISQTTLCNQERIMRCWLQNNSQIAQIILHA